MRTFGLSSVASPENLHGVPPGPAVSDPFLVFSNELKYSRLWILFLWQNFAGGDFPLSLYDCN